MDLEADLVNIVRTTVVDPKTGEPKAVKVPVVPKFVARKLDVPDLRQAQADFGAAVARPGGAADRPRFAVSGRQRRRYDGARQSLSFQVSANTEALTVSTVPPRPHDPARAGDSSDARDARRRRSEVLANYSMPARMSGTYATDHGARKLVLSALSVKDNKQWLSIDKAGTDFQVLLPPEGPPTAQGELQLAADGAAWSDVARKLGGAAEDPNAVKLVRAMIEGTLKLADPPAGSAPAGSTDVAADVHVTQLTLAGQSQPGQSGQPAPPAPGVQNESIDLTLRVGAEPGFSRIKVSQCDAIGSVFTAHVPDRRRLAHDRHRQGRRPRVDAPEAAATDGHAGSAGRGQGAGVARRPLPAEAGGGGGAGRGGGQAGHAARAIGTRGVASGRRPAGQADGGQARRHL